MMGLRKGAVLGIVGGVVFALVGFSFMLVPWSSAWYSTMFPQMVGPGAALAMAAAVFAAGLFMGLVYSVIGPAVPGAGAKRGLTYGFVVWLLAGLMWPIMMVGFAPPLVWITELASGLITHLVTGTAIAIAFEKL
jgi:hypothetical protein